jgi:membrane-associated phospholipid phosphatase
MEGSAADVNRFWIAVLMAGLACYATLPWLVSRPPRLAERNVLPPRQIAAANVFVLGRVSHQLNTFPSGHVAVSFASAACVASVSTTAGAIVALMATAIAVGAVAGRYHYVIDVLIGVLIAAAAALVVLI